MPSTTQDSHDAAMAHAHSIFVRLALPPYTIHFKSPSFMKEATMEMLDKRVCKETLKKTAQKAEVRWVISREEIGGEGC